LPRSLAYLQAPPTFRLQFEKIGDKGQFRPMARFPVNRIGLFSPGR